MQITPQGTGGNGAATVSRVADLYDPRREFDVRWRDAGYRGDGSASWLARIYEPQGAGPFPALLEVHGGAWNRNDWRTGRWTGWKRGR